MGNLVESEVVEGEAIELPPEDMFSTYIKTSTKLRKKMIDIYGERLEHQRELLKKKMNLDQDIEQKNLYSDYLDEIYTIEKEAVDKLNKISLDRENELANDKDEIYQYFDNARKRLERWKESNPRRYEKEMAYLDKKESIKIQTIEENAMQLFEESQKMFDEVIAIFRQHDQEIAKKLPR